MLLRAKDKPGATEAVYRLYTNDPRHSTVEFRTIAVVKPVPDYVKRIGNANLAVGEKIGIYRFYPTAKPDVMVEQNEHFKMAIRIRAVGTEDGELKLAAAVEQAVCTLKREESGDYYVLDIESEPIGAAQLRTIKIPLHTNSGKQESFDVIVTLHLANNRIVFTPDIINCGEVSLSSLKSEAVRVGRVGIRKQVGKFQITAVSSSLPFLHPEVQTIVDGNNYLIRLNTLSNNLPKAGAYEGVIRVETDDPGSAKLEIPVKIVLKQ